MPPHAAQKFSAAMFAANRNAAPEAAANTKQRIPELSQAPKRRAGASSRAAKGAIRHALFLTTSGLELPSTQSRVMRTSLMLPSDGISYMTSVIRFSMMVRSPRAPVLSLIAVLAISLTAEGSKESFTPVHADELFVLLQKRVLRLGEDLDERRLVQRVQAHDDGDAPDELGDQPELGEILRLDLFEETVIGLLRALDLAAEPEGGVVLARLHDLIQPHERPAADEENVVVSMRMHSCCGCFLPPCGGTLATVLSMIFKSACCTPSPETSRVIETFSPLRAILSTSSM